MAKTGLVYLVGAGPGDPGLLTIKGRECLAEADVVLYDYLANSSLLEHVRDSAEIVYVGKQADRHTMKQEEIHKLLVEKARAGLTIVRLKGGDPFVFGRGPEEAIALRREGIPFIVVPGVTSGVAALAYAGIPATYREHSSMLTLITGHEDPEKAESAIDWKALACRSGTLVFYMGVGNLPEITRALETNGKSPDTPAAVIRWGTLPSQEVVVGTLADIAQRVAVAKLKPPAIIVFGEVVGVREELNWFESQPLFGKTIVVTRSRTQASKLVAKLVALGACTLQLPTIRIEPIDDRAEINAAIDTIAEFDWIVFTSVNAVEHFFMALCEQGLDSRALSQVKTCSIGTATAERLKNYGINTDLLPTRFTSDGVFDILVEKKEIKGSRFLLPRADIADPGLPRKLRESGATVDDIAVYHTATADVDQAAIEALRDGNVDAVTFTSSSTARNFASLIEPVLGKLPDVSLYASIGPETSKASEAAGMPVGIEAEEHTIDGLIAALIEHYRQNGS